MLRILKGHLPVSGDLLACTARERRLFLASRDGAQCVLQFPVPKACVVGRYRAQSQVIRPLPHSAGLPQRISSHNSGLIDSTPEEPDLGSQRGADWGNPWLLPEVWVPRKCWAAWSYTGRVEASNYLKCLLLAQWPLGAVFPVFLPTTGGWSVSKGSGRLAVDSAERMPRAWSCCDPVSLFGDLGPPLDVEQVTLSLKEPGWQCCGGLWANL